MIKFSIGLPLLGALLLPLAVAAQLTFQLSEYRSALPGDTLQLKNMLGDQLEPLVMVYDTVRFRGLLVTRRLDNQTVQRIEQFGPKGWQLNTLGIGAGKELIFDTPLLLMPATVKQGEVFEQKVAYTLIEQKQKKGAGTLSYSVKIEGNDSSRTPLQNFADCLVTTTTIIRQATGSNTKEGYTVKEWYARGIGLIKSAGEVFSIDAAGKQQIKGRVALMLERAVVNGQVYEKD